MKNYWLVLLFGSYSLLRPVENLGSPIVKKLSELFPSVQEVATVQEISCTQPYHRISFNLSKCYDSYFHPSCFVEKVHIEGKWNCHRPSFSRCDEPGFRENIKYIEISQKICGNECGSWISWSQSFSGERGSDYLTTPYLKILEDFRSISPSFRDYPMRTSREVAGMLPK